MPIYEYYCPECKKEFEKLQKISDAPLVKCPDCEKDTLQKLVSASRFKLTGSGWYETDFKNKPAAKPEGKETIKDKIEENKKETVSSE